jgi:branched-chain amino acid transport system permease protein
VFGPLYGATLLLMLEEVLSSYTEHWQVLLGPILVILVLFAKNGVVSLIDMAWRRTK